MADQDPKRLLDSAESSDLARLLASAKSVDPPAGASAAIWRALSSSSTASSTAIGASKAGALTALKALALTLAIGTSERPSMVAERSDSESKIQLNQPHTSANPVIALSSPPMEFPEISPEPAPKELVQQARSELRKQAPRRDLPQEVVPSPPSISSLLAEESEGLLQARALLRRRSASEALHLLQAMDIKFGAASPLAEERDALLIEALALAGLVDAASVRAHAFLNNPNYIASPLVKTVRRFVR